MRGRQQKRRERQSRLHAAYTAFDVYEYKEAQDTLEAFKRRCEEERDVHDDTPGGLIIHICKLALHADRETFSHATRWGSEVDRLNRCMQAHWTPVERASLVALLKRFKQVLQHLLGNPAGQSVFTPVSRQMSDANHEQIVALFVSGAKLAPAELF